MRMESGDLHHRLVTDGEDADDEDSGTEDYDDDYDDELDDQTDPGKFRYNKRLLIISLPCFLLVITLTGELLLCIAGIGATMVSVLHSYGEHERSLVVFMVTFLMSQISILYTVLPLVWISLANIILIGLINGYTVMTGFWLVIQLPAFRMQSPDSLQFMETSLFTFYPGFCVTLCTWAVCFTLLPVKFAPFVLLLLGFAVLHLFLVPSKSSFHLPKRMIRDTQIVDSLVFGLISVVFTVAPSLVHVSITILHNHKDLISVEMLVQGTFIFSASVFLSTFLGLRKLIEHIGWSYDIVIRGRWVSGLFVAVMTSPLLRGMGATSPLLSWLPVVVAAYCCYGILLSYKRHKLFSLGCAMVLIILHVYHVGWLPWKLHYSVPVVGIHISFVHILILANAVLCLISGYVATHGTLEALGTICSLQTIIFICTEMFLKLLDLYSTTLTICTGAVGIYLSLRFFQVKKLPWTASWFATSCHVTKVATCCLNLINSEMIGSRLLSYITTFLLVALLTYLLIFEDHTEMTEKQTYVSIGLVYALSAMNVYSTGPGVWQTALNSEPCFSDLTGLWLFISGVVVHVLSQVHFPPFPIIQHSGLLSILLGAVVVFLQPDTSSKTLMAEYWGTVLTLPFLYGIISRGPYSSLKHIIVVGGILSLFPSLFLVSLTYSSEASTLLHVLWLVTLTVVVSLYLVVFNSNFSIMKTEEYTLNLYVAVLCLLGISLLQAVIHHHGDLPSPAFVSKNLCTVMLLVVTVAGKMFAVHNQDIPQRLIDEHKLRNTLPLVSNGSVAATFLLLCLSCPFEGIASGLWFVMSSASLLCLQWDNWLLKKFSSRNQITPMLVMSISILLLSAIYNSAFWELCFSLQVFFGFWEIALILTTLPGYVLFWLLLWTGKIMMSEKLVVFVAPLNLVILLLASSSSSVLLSLSGLVVSVWLMVFKFTLLRDAPVSR